MKIGIWACGTHGSEPYSGATCSALDLAHVFLHANPSDEVVLVLSQESRTLSTSSRIQIETAPRTTPLRHFAEFLASLVEKPVRWSLVSRKRFALLLPLLPLLALAWLLVAACRLAFPQPLGVPTRFTYSPSFSLCDVWLVLAPPTSFPFPPGTPVVWLLDRPLPPTLADGSFLVDLASQRMNVLFAVPRTAPLDPLLHASTSFTGRLREVPSPEQGLPSLAPALHALLAEATALPRQVPSSTPQPRFVPTPRKPHLHLFLPIAYQGGVWEATVRLVVGLAEVGRNSVHLSLALHPNQQGRDTLARLAPELHIETLTPVQLPDNGLPWSPSALAADAWLALVDRFHTPFVPPVPLAVLIYDVIQSHAPDLFEPVFRSLWMPAMRQIVSRSSLVITTNPVTRADVEREYKLPPDRTVVVPVACEPGLRFAGLQPAPLAHAVPDSFLLTLTNVSPHKGLPTILRALALLKHTHGRAPALVVTGVSTEQASPNWQGPRSPRAQACAALATELGLVPDRDLWYLGYATDAQLLGLLQRCSGVINAAQFDNGTFSLIEAHWFGKPTLCSRYPAAVALNERFGVPAAYFPVDDHEALALLMAQAARRPPLPAEQVAAQQAALCSPHLGHRHFAEQVLRLLLALARPAGERLAA